MANHHICSRHLHLSHCCLSLLHNEPPLFYQKLCSVGPGVFREGTNATVCFKVFFECLCFERILWVCAVECNKMFYPVILNFFTNLNSEQCFQSRNMCFISLCCCVYPTETMQFVKVKVVFLVVSFLILSNHCYCQ